MAIAGFLYRVLSNFAHASGRVFRKNKETLVVLFCAQSDWTLIFRSPLKGKTVCFWASPTCSPLLPGCTRAVEEWFTTRASPWRSAPTRMSRKGKKTVGFVRLDWWVGSGIEIYVCLKYACHLALWITRFFIIYFVYNQREFRSETSDNMKSWKAEWRSREEK